VHLSLHRWFVVDSDWIHFDSASFTLFPFNLTDIRLSQPSYSTYAAILWPIWVRDPTPLVPLFRSPKFIKEEHPADISLVFSQALPGGPGIALGAFPEIPIQTDSGLETGFAFT